MRTYNTSKKVKTLITLEEIESLFTFLEKRLFDGMKKQFIKIKNKQTFLKCYTSESFVKKSILEEIKKISGEFWKKSRKYLGNFGRNQTQG